MAHLYLECEQELISSHELEFMNTCRQICRTVTLESHQLEMQCVDHN